MTALHVAAGNVTTWLGDWSRRRGGSSLGGVMYSGRLDPARRLSLVKALLAQGADPNSRITTSAMFMNYVGYPKKGAFEPYACGTGDLTARRRSGSRPSPRTEAARRRTSASRIDRKPEGGAAALLAAGANLRLTTEDGSTPLMAAAGLGRATYTPREPRGSVRRPPNRR